MAVVVNQAQLLVAVAAKDPEIQVGDNFSLSVQISVNDSFTLRSTEGNSFTITKNDGYYGALFRVYGGTLTLENITLDGDILGHSEENASARSLIIVSGGRLIMNAQAVLQNNKSYLEGGGVYLAGNASYVNSLVMNEGSVIQGCNSRTNGGGINVAARNQGDGIVLNGNAKIINNRAAYGGGIYYRSYVREVTSELTVGANVLIEGNEAASAGGGINFSGYREGANGASDLTIREGASIRGNRAVNGGGIYFYGAYAGDTLNLTAGPNVADNVAEQNGGGICYSGVAKTDLMIDDATVYGNQGRTGGGIYFLTSAGGSASIAAAVVANNAATQTGGGVWIQNTSQDDSFELSVRDAQFETNRARQGGGLSFTPGEASYRAEIEGVLMHGNVAEENGGAVSMGAAGSGVVALRRSTFQQNTAGHSGGAIYFAGNESKNTRNQIFLTEVIVNENKAGYEGGGLRLVSLAGQLETVIVDGTVSYNTAEENSGGGIWMGGTSNSLELKGNTQVSYNSTEAGSGGGIYFNVEMGALYLRENCKVLYNRASGAVTDYGNYGGGICVIPGNIYIEDEAEIAGNRALRYGGGISAAEQSKVTMNGGTIHDNICDERGGGIYNKNSGILDLFGGEVYGNSAKTGGGIYNDLDGELYVRQENRCGETAPNRASEYAPGIFNASYFQTEGDRDLANGVYILSRKAVVRLSDALAAGSVIQIDRSVYVKPNDTGTPIVIAERTESYPNLTSADAEAFRKPPADFDGWEVRLYENDTQVVLIPEVYGIRYENLFGSLNPNPDRYTVVTPDIVLLGAGPREGYRFIRWEDENGNPFERIPKGSIGDITLYAIWEELPEKTYLLKYLPNDVYGPPAGNIPPSVFLTEGASVRLSRLIPTRRGYRFLGWSRTPSGVPPTYLPGEVIGIASQTILLYAVWTSVNADADEAAYRRFKGDDCASCCFADHCCACFQSAECCDSGGGQSKKH